MKLVRYMYWLFVSCIGMLFSPYVLAQGDETVSHAEFQEITISVQDENRVNASVLIDLRLSQELNTALNKGMPLFFTLDIKLFEPKQFWLDKLIHQESRTIGISYNMLLREWRVSQNNREFKEFSLDDALRRITQLDNWGLILAQPLSRGKAYEGQIRLKLDTSLLARPFQVTAFNNSSAWSFSSVWKNFDFHFLDKKLN